MKPTVPEVQPLVDALYKRNGVGCCLHIVLDDGNFCDDSVRFCIEQSGIEHHEDCLKLGNLLLLMSRTQRKKLAYGGRR